MLKKIGLGRSRLKWEQRRKALLEDKFAGSLNFSEALVYWKKQYNLITGERFFVAYTNEKKTIYRPELDWLAYKLWQDSPTTFLEGGQLVYKHNKITSKGYFNLYRYVAPPSASVLQHLKNTDQDQYKHQEGYLLFDSAADLF